MREEKDAQSVADIFIRQRNLVFSTYDTINFSSVSMETLELINGRRLIVKGGQSS